MIPLPAPHVVIGFLIDHTKTVIDYINDVRNANEDQRNLSAELMAMQTVLAQLDSHADDEDWKETMEALVTTGGPFDQLKLELKRMKRKLEPPTSKFRKAGRALGYHFTKDDVKKHFDRIERIKSLLQLAVENNHRFGPFKAPSNSSELTKAVRDEMGSVKEMLKGKYLFYCEGLIEAHREKLEGCENLQIIRWLSDLNFLTK